MLAVGIETSGQIGSVCLREKDVLRREEVFSEGLVHGRELATALKRVLNHARAVLADVDFFGVSLGPGSYTGIRIGVVFTRMLSRLLGAGAFGVSSLEALAYARREEGPFLAPVLNARWGMVYGALFRGEGRLVRMTDDALHEPGVFARSLPEGTVVFGDGIEAYGEDFGGHRRIERGEGRVLSASVAALALERFRVSAPPEELAPRYLKPWGPPRPEAGLKT